MSDNEKPGTRFLGNFAAQGCARALSTLTTMVFFVLIARLAGAETLGRVSYVLAYLSITAAFADLGTGNVLARDLTATDPHRNLYLGNFVLLRMVLAVVAVAGGFAVTLFIPSSASWPIRAFLVTAPLLGVRFFDTIFQIFGKPWYSAAIAFAKTVLTIPFAFAALTHGAGLTACLMIYVGPELCCFAAGWVLTRHLLRLRIRFQRATIMKIGRVALPIGISAAFLLVNNRINVFMLAALQGPAELGIYSAAYRFLDLGTTVIMTLTVPLLPVLSDHARQAPHLAQATYRALMATLLGLAMPVAVVTPFISPYVIGLLYGPGYAAAAPILDILVWAFVLTLYDSVTFAFLLSIQQIRHAHWNSIAAACVNVGLNAWLIPALGISGAAWATLGSVLSLAVGQALILHHARLRVFDRQLLALCVINAVLVLAVTGLRMVGMGVLVVGPILVYSLLVRQYGLIPWAELRERIVNAREVIPASESSFAPCPTPTIRDHSNLPTA